MDGTAELRDALEREGVRVRFAAGQTLMHQGDPPTHVALLLSGAVKVVLHLPEGERLLLAVRGPGEILGVMGVLGAAPRSATVVAALPCAVRVLAADRFRALVRAEGEEAALLRGALERLREGERWRAETATLPAVPRVARALLCLALPGDADGPPVVVLSQSEIGAAVGMSRGAVAAELARLRAAHLVDTAVRKVVLTDSAGLRALAGPGRRGVVSMTPRRPASRHG
ncbi:Crp/Fnr family transcriptional regulator [Actinocorallia sp. A-T 12471]|uniref:Crp/Fnr family transcriptional regulator n=1 Tax=Actinocorallia sp. A-T 12471 TaxID=3089813 RepID=UPI0029D1AC53|nr:Crp/Fnr family transcriptional regulator [Actinocorallia sp. A-T 12471]MDX6742811.1 Crp/Fnr family transcriptional regulator [Actinocorallia sp. A-T 12471]